MELARWRADPSAALPPPGAALPTPHTSCPPRPAPAVPRWHYDMVLDGQRNDAYAAAISRAVQRKRAAGCSDLLALDLGAGSGLLSMMAARWVGTCQGGVTGWLAWLPWEALLLRRPSCAASACRFRLLHSACGAACCTGLPAHYPSPAGCRSAGADAVVAAEVSQHMCDVGEEACVMNGFLGRITMLDR